jgi:hypothetical protein
MLRHLEVSRLSRPARLRCRPALLCRPKSTSVPPLPHSTPASWSAEHTRRPSTTLSPRPRPAIAGKKAEHERSLSEESASQLFRRRNEDRDYDQARQLKEERSTRSAGACFIKLVVQAES